MSGDQLQFRMYRPPSKLPCFRVAREHCARRFPSTSAPGAGMRPRNEPWVTPHQARIDAGSNFACRMTPTPAKPACCCSGRSDWPWWIKLVLGLTGISQPPIARWIRMSGLSGPFVNSQPLKSPTTHNRKFPYIYAKIRRSAGATIPPNSHSCAVRKSVRRLTYIRSYLDRA
jgi:hypothetical protein